MARDLFIEITNHCNFHCSFCASDLQSRPQGMMSLELFRKVCDDVVEDRLTDHIAFHVMGEPFLHAQLFDFLEYSHGKGLRVILNTNCSLLTEEKVTKLLSTLHGALLLSVQTPTPQTFELRHAPKLSWDDYLKGIRRVLRLYLSRTKGSPGENYIELHMLNTKYCQPNAQVISSSEQGREMVKQWAELIAEVEKEVGLDFTGFRNERLADLGDPLTPEQHGVAYELAPGILLRFKGAGSFANYRVRRGAAVLPKKNGTCRMPFQQLAVLWNGDVSLCCLDFNGEMVVGNVKETRLRDIWLGRGANLLREEMSRDIVTNPLCQQCVGEVVQPRSLGDLAQEIMANYRHGGIPSVYRGARGFIAKRLAVLRQTRTRPSQPKDI